MKRPAQVITDIGRRLTNNWHTDLTGDTNTWPADFPIGQPTKADLDANYSAFHDRIYEWVRWADAHNVTLRTVARNVSGTRQTLPTHVTITSIDHAAEVVDNHWPNLLTTGRHRFTQLTARFPHTTTAGILRTVGRYEDIDFDLLLTVADWFTREQPEGFTPRQVPIPGVHAKWLNTHNKEVAALGGRDTLGLLPAHPPRIHFTYLDPAHRTTGGRVHDSATVGDTFRPAYTPQIVVISENKDTAIHFPPIAGAIAVEGDGFGGSTAAAFPWITGAARLYYWGDIDSHGFEILNGFRQAGVPVTSILMNADTYDTYEPFGTNLGANKQPIPVGVRKPLEHLTSTEAALYDRLTDPTWTGHRRIEQERIPLAVAAAAVNRG